MKFSQFAFLAAFLFLFEARATSKDCPTVDYTSRFAETKNQGYHQYCWAMAATALLEEEACLNNSSNCGKALSTLDASRCHFRFGHSVETGLPHWALECGMEQGVCQETDAPFLPIQSKNSLLNTILGKQFQQTEFVKYFLKYKSLQDKKSQASLLEELMHSTISEYYNYSPQSSWTENDLNYFVRVAKDLAHFLDLTAIGKNCEPNRISFSPKRIFNRFNSQKNPLLLNYYSNNEVRSYEQKEPLGNLIKERLMTGKSLAVGVCMDEIFPIYNLLSKKPCSYGHVVVINGMHWNQEQQQCEFHVKNSYGDRPELSGWIEASKISKATYLINQIE